MKLVVQRVSKASVKTIDNNEIVGKIYNGLFVLVGISRNDTEQEAYDLAEKLYKLRILKDEKDKMNLSVIQTGMPVLVVSQFTLLANTKGGNRPSFIDAAEPDKARNIYDFFITTLRNFSCKVEVGSFGSYMEIDVVLDGPVTIILET